ncbi:DUF4432 family protein [Rhizobium paknamense]|uniref:DUF4432 family protein n=1 Tax=Rhizobium paknamense TaxID=1206817 RepID=A0ABU0I939_9HYPH|nr:DUF4432 family protein [Rhizobium paknamense]MDQ0454757.1 hypothetical protein [Rhizobium paknamense]
MKLKAADPKVLGPEVELDPGSVLDIRSLVINGVDLAPGRAIPDDGDPRIDHSLEGFLFTCGPDHIRHPFPLGDGSGGRYPLHGSFSSHAARIVGQGVDFCQASIDVHHADGGQSRLERHWRIDSAGKVHLLDRLVNTGPAAFPAFLMYHMNVGARLFDDRVRLEGPMLEGGGFGWRFGQEPGGVFCVPAQGGDDAGLTLGPLASLGGLALKVQFATNTLPYLQIWRNQQAPANVLGIEPVSHAWVDRDALERRGDFLPLHPGEAREFALSFWFEPAD